MTSAADSAQQRGIFHEAPMASIGAGRNLGTQSLGKEMAAPNDQEGFLGALLP